MLTKMLNRKMQLDKLKFFSTLKTLSLTENVSNTSCSVLGIELDLGLMLINKERYPKALFVEEDINGALLSIVDNHEDFKILLSETKGFGHYVHSKPFTFRHRLIGKIFFSLNIYPFCNKYSFFLNNLNKLFYCLEKHNIKPSKTCMGLIFLRANRGGFRCIYIGVLGFLPNKHITILIPLLFSSYGQKIYSKVNAILFSKNYYSLFFTRIYWSFVTKIRCFRFFSPKNYKHKIKRQKLVKRLIKEKIWRRRKRKGHRKKLLRILFLCQKSTLKKKLKRRERTNQRSVKKDLKEIKIKRVNVSRSRKHDLR